MVALELFQHVVSADLPALIDRMKQLSFDPKNSQVCVYLRLRPGHQFALHNGRGELASQTVRKVFQPANRHRLHTLKLEVTLRHDLLETSQRQFVESSCNFLEMVSRPARVFAIPAHQHVFAEHQMRPRKNREPVTAERVKPRRPKARENVTVVLQKLSHHLEHRGRISKMLERIEADNDVDLFIGMRRENATTIEAGCFRSRARDFQRLLAYVQPNHLTYAMLG